jgi:hypothetical protein
VRVWDVSPGYLSRQRLLGEHRELHGLYNVLIHGTRGYARHPETLRWVGAVPGLVARHAQLAAEMRLRGYTDRTPLARRGRVRWPGTFVTEPTAQFALLRAKYAGTSAGRIPLPRNAQQLWAQHKYSVMARDPESCRALGRMVARMRAGSLPPALAIDLVRLLREPPPSGRLVSALEHMWGHVARHGSPDEQRAARRSPAGMLVATQTIAVRISEPFLLASTALGDLGVYT